MNFILVAFMTVLMTSVIFPVIVIMGMEITGMIVRMLVFMNVFMYMSVNMLMGMNHGTVRMLMFMLVTMLMGMKMFVFVIALHMASPFRKLLYSVVLPYHNTPSFHSKNTCYRSL